MSNFDTLLDLDSPAEKSSNPTGNGPSLDPFDPFGPSPPLETKGGNDLLLNYEVSVQNGTSTENGAANGNLFEFETSQGSNPLYDLCDEDDQMGTEDLAALIKQQATAGEEEGGLIITETVTTDEDGQTTVVTTRRSRSYDSDRERSPEINQVVEEITTTTDDGDTIARVTTTTTESSYYDENTDFTAVKHQDESLEEQSFEERSFEEPPSTEEQSFEEQPSVEEQSYEERPSAGEQSFEERPSEEDQSFQENQSVEEPSTEESPYVDFVSEERQSFDENPAFYETPEITPRKSKSRSKSPSISSSDEEQVQEDPKANKEEEIIKNGATFYRTKEEQHFSDEQQETQRTVKEEVTPGQIKSPFFGDMPMGQNGVDDEDVERDPNVARETKDRETIRFSELGSFKNKFEAGVESQKTSTVSPEELDQVRQSGGAGSLRNKFESVAKGEQDFNQGRKSMREITPPHEGAKVVYETEAVRNPDVVRADDVVDEGAYMPKPGSSKEIWAKFQSGRVQDSAPKQRTSVIDEIQTQEGGVFENEPQINPDVVRSGEGDAFADLPSTGSTRNVLSKFKQMESGTGYVPAPRGVREITPPASGKVEYVSEPIEGVEKYVGKAESGVFESQPSVRSDVVRSGEIVEEDQLPQQGFTKSAAALFRQKEAEAARVKTASTGALRQITPPRDASVVYESQPQRLPDVVRAEDKVEEEDLPQQGAARNMLAKFREMESSGNQTSQVKRDMKAFTPPRDGGVYENTPEKFVPNYNAKAEGGVFENQPQQRADVVRADDRSEEDLPEQGMARNMVARFRQLSESTKSQSPVSPKSPHDRSFKEFTPPRDEPRTPGKIGVQPSDMPEQYQQASGGVSENTPEQRSDVFREADTDYAAGMPAPSTTKNLLARFKAIQHDAKVKEQPKPLRKESPQLSRSSPSSNTPDKPKEGGLARFRVVQSEKCDACQKTVYAMEKMEFNKNVYHKTCFKCSHCKNRLTPATFSVNQGILYCLNHFKQMFKTKGNYDEGFGREQYKKKWKSEPNIAGLADEEHSSSRS